MSAPREPLPAPRPARPKRFGRYEVRRPIGRGSFGTVYEGFDAELERPVAIKVSHVGESDSPERHAAFLREARQLARLQHPRIVMVFDAGVEGEHRYIVSALISGQSLFRHIKEHKPSYRETARIIAEIADALAHAHAQGIVHRDVKPSNVLLTDDGTPVLVDFGLAFVQSDAGSLVPGRPTGTPAYMSPEQVYGKAHAIGARSDIYSLGVVMYRMLAGVLPFVARDNEKLFQQILEMDPGPPSSIDDGVPEELDRICMRAMSRNRAERYDTASEMATELRRFLDSGVTGRSNEAGPAFEPMMDEASDDGSTGVGALSAEFVSLDGPASRFDAAAAMRAGDYPRACLRLERVLAEVDASSEGSGHDEAEIRIAYAHALRFAQGPASPLLQATLDRLGEIMQVFPDRPEAARFAELLASTRLGCGDIDGALSTVREMLARGREDADPQTRAEAHRAAGSALSALGDTAAGRNHFEQALDSYEPPADASATVLGYYDCAVESLAGLGIDLWVLGFHDESRRRLDEAIGLAVELAHRPSIAFARARSAVLNIELARFADARLDTTELARIVEAGGPTEWRPWATLLDGVLEAQDGAPEEAVIRIQEGLNELRNLGVEWERHRALKWMASACLSAEQIERGLEAVDEALDSMHPRGDPEEPELFRVRASLLLAKGDDFELEAEDLLMRARDTARYQTARTFELRATLELDRLWKAQARDAEAFESLESIVTWFAEGDGDSPELRQAAARLDAHRSRDPES